MISLKAVEFKFLEIRNKVEAVSDSKNAVISNLEQRQMQLSAELVHQRQQKQGLTVSLGLVQKLLGERENTLK